MVAMTSDNRLSAMPCAISASRCARSRNVQTDSTTVSSSFIMTERGIDVSLPMGASSATETITESAPISRQITAAFPVAAR